jgi:hypothetical protein
MAVRLSMTNLITRVRVLINDPLGASQVFDDQTIQDIMDESREDVVNRSLLAKPTFSGSTISYLNYYSQYGGWEDDYVLKQYMTVTITPSAVEPIAGHFAFSASTLPPVCITGKLHDVYRAAADLLERWTAKWALAYSFSSDGQSFQRHQASLSLLNLAKQYRTKQRPRMVNVMRSDLTGGSSNELTLGAQPIDYMASGNG